MLERDYQPHVIDELKKRLPGCVIQKLDTSYRQGVPDLLILYCDNWAILEVKRKRPKPGDFQPNQEWYIEQFNEMSFAACIYPENEQEVLDALQLALSTCHRRVSRVS